MSRSMVPPPEFLSGLQRRLQGAEDESEELGRGLGVLGVSADHLVFSPSTQHPFGPEDIHPALDADGEVLLWRLCETLVSRVCRLESLLHALKLSTFRLETDRELNPSHAGHLQEQINILQGQYEEEQSSSRKEILKLQDRLQQVCDERKDAQQEVLRLTEALQSTIHANREQTAWKATAEQSHNALILKMGAMERVAERKSVQMKALEAECHNLRADRQISRAELKKKAEQILRLERECEQLRGQSGVKRTLISELNEEIKVLNDKLEVQCSELKSTILSLTLENTRLHTEYQNSIEEQKQLFDIQAELQRTTSENLTLQKQLEVLKADHAKLQQTSSVALQTAVNHQHLLKKTIERLQEELRCTMNKDENIRREGEKIKIEMSSKIILLENEKNLLETQLSEIKVELSTVSCELQKQKKENKALMDSLAVIKHQQESYRQVEQMLWDLTENKNKLAYEKGKLQVRVQQMGEELKMLKAECTQYCQVNTTLRESYTQAHCENNTLKEHLQLLQQQHREMNEVVRVLENVLPSHALLQKNTQTLQTELQDKAQQVHKLKKQKLQDMKEIQKLRTKVEHLEKLAHTTSNQVESLQKTLDESQMDNRKLAECLEQHLQEHHNTQKKLNSLNQREVELKEARAEIHRLTEHIDSLKKLLRRKKDSTRQLKKARDEASVKSLEFSRANQDLQKKVSELEKLVSRQKSHIKTAEKSSLRMKVLEAEVENLEEIQSEYKNISYNQRLEESLKCLQDERDEAEMGHWEITENTAEDLRDLCSLSEIFNEEHEPQKLTVNSRRTEKDCTPTAEPQNRRQAHSLVCDPDLESWAFTLQRWQMKNEHTHTDPTDVCKH